MSLTRIGRWFARAVLAHYDRRAVPRQSLKGWRGAWHCIDMVLCFMRWAAIWTAIAVPILVIAFPPSPVPYYWAEVCAWV